MKQRTKHILNKISFKPKEKSKKDKRLDREKQAQFVSGNYHDMTVSNTVVTQAKEEYTGHSSQPQRIVSDSHNTQGNHMELIEKKIKVDVTDIVKLLGVNDAHLHLLENRFDATVSARGETLSIKGEPSEVKRIERVIQELQTILRRTGQLTLDDVTTVIDLLSGASASKADDSVFLRGSGDVGTVKARTPNQQDYLDKVRKNDIVFAVGPAGTGKTFLAVAMAVNALRNREVSRIILTRPAVEAGESLGFLPGDLNEKVDPYLRPLFDALGELTSPEKLRSWNEKKIIEIVPLAYMRGRTLNNSFIILDEAQNTTITQMKMFLTRLGRGSKMIVTGDITQIDLPTKKMSGLVNVRDVLRNIQGIEFVEFDKSDVVRHRLVSDIIEAYEREYDYNERKNSKQDVKNELKLEKNTESSTGS